MTNEQKELKIISDAMVLAEERWNGTPWKELSPEQRAAVMVDARVSFSLGEYFA